MRTLIMLLIILAIIITSSFVSQHMLNTSSRRLAKRLQHIHSSLMNQDFSSAKRHLAAAEPLWEKTRVRWSLITDHHEIDMIEDSWVRFKSNLKLEERNKALEELSAILRLVNHIPTKEKFNLENIL